MEDQKYQVLLYYKFVRIEDPKAFRDAHFALCKRLNLLGRILIAEEGVNGTVSGLKEDTDDYMRAMSTDPLFEGIEFKVDAASQHAFNKLHIRVKEEIIRFDIEGLNPEAETGAYVEPEEFQKILKESDENDDIVILDTRSDYEFVVGKFKNAITLDINNFRELPDKLEELRPLMKKRIYTYCTGGIRCEKVTAWMIQEGFEQVYQLHGGIVNYGKVTGGENFEGGCYVFDQRVVVPVNHVNPTVIGKCQVCESPTEKMINCANPMCNDHFLICKECADKLKGCCSESCSEAPDLRSYDGTGYYLRGINSKNYAKL